ncbi:MAG: non-canonical purine NTP pyrophosphatase [Flavobacterium sp.]|uniref:non-canonical purine NTP diphosphatase n=1 Tax=unclassified Flavobacterium TaxID=196869 RepID=UPI000C5A31CA|nr:MULTISPECIES: non-canonical purine NTP diphosphatase [unclassified Flavobacterium]MBF02471.1 non-canonical purine NTP pyrophosphatase [Flavobacterium sp.]MCO6163732.1 non-canonical purine NTP diphosphatase [Flavobacterium sp. NRK F7]
MKLVFASNNKNKIAEIQQLMPLGITVLSLEEIGCDVDIPETASTIEGNAILKANYVTEHFGYDCFADDTGLEVEALNGAPGVYSARYAGEQKNADDNMTKLLLALENHTNRKAQFKTVIALNINKEQHLFTGIASGVIIGEKKGEKGFGYDPIFKPNELDKTFAELSMEEKSKYSHRAKAVNQLLTFLQKHFQ